MGRLLWPPGHGHRRAGPRREPFRAWPEPLRTWSGARRAWP